MTKICSKCYTRKRLTEYYKLKGSKDGKMNTCKECHKKRVRRNYYKNIEYYTKYYTERRATPEHREYERNRSFWRRIFDKDGKHAKVYTIVSNAKRDGILIPEPCEVCGTTERIHAHHDDYSKPLDVRWICQSHHLELHGKTRRTF